MRFLVAESFWANWHPYLHTAQVQGRLQKQLFDRLMEIETSDFSKLTPKLAKSWKQLDELTWQFDLRQGVRFHGGQEFTAEDVKASIELASGATPIQTNTASRWVPTTVDVVDKYTAHVRTKTPFGPFLLQVATLDIISATDAAKGVDTMKATPNGTGAFRLAADEKDRKSLEAFTGYWAGPPKLKSLVWEFIQDAQTRLSALLAGQAQVIDRVPPEHFQVLRGTNNVQLVQVPGLENVNLWMRMDQPPFGDNAKLREAVYWSVDREALVKNLVGGASEAAKSHIPNRARFAAAQQPMYTYDPDRAKAALAAAGYGSGGPEFGIHGTVGFQPRSQEVVEAIADNMRKVGMRPTVTVTNVAGIVSAISDPKKPGSLFHLSWGNPNGDPHSSLAFLYKKGSVYGVYGHGLDEMIDGAAATTNDDERSKRYAEIQSFLWKNFVHLPLYNSDFTVAHLKSVTGLLVLLNFATYFHDVSSAS